MGTKHFVFIIIVHSSCRMTPKGMECLHKGYALGGFHRWLSGKESACQCRRCRRCRFNPWAEMIPWSRKWQPAPVFLPGKFLGQRSLVGYSPWSHKESNMTERLSMHTNIQFIDIKYQYIHSVVQPSPQSISRTFPSSLTENLLNTH